MNRKKAPVLLDNDFAAFRPSPQESLRVAIKANPLNAPLAPVDDKGRIIGKNVSRLCARGSKLWGQEPCLKVWFLDGSTAQQNQVMTALKKWENAGALYFLFGNYPDAQIRVTFNGTGACSNIGTDALTVPSPNPTVTLALPTLYDHDILHEFGHVLGFYHEHQQPNCNLQWNEANVIRDAQAWYGWSLDAIRYNILEKCGRGYFYSGYDPASIMHYWIDRTWHTGNYEIAKPTDLSPTDEYWCRSCYPSVSRRAGITINDAPRMHTPHPFTDGLYQFTITEKGSYTFTLGGEKGTTAAGIFGPANDAAFVDVVHGGTTKVVSLAPGTYLYKVRHEAEPNQAPATIPLSISKTQALARKQATRGIARGGEVLTFAGDIIQRTYRAKKGDTVEVVVVGQPDDAAQITFGDPEPGGPVTYLPLAGDSTTEIARYFAVGKNPIRLSVVNSGKGIWNGTFTLRINGVDTITVDGNGDDGWFVRGFHTLIRAMFIYQG